MNEDILQKRDQIIRKALPEVTFDGWSWDVIEAAAKVAGYDVHMAAALFPGGLVDALDGFADLADREMLRALEKCEPDDMRVRDRVKAGVMARLEFLQPHKEAVREASSFWIVPHRKPRAAKIVWRTADRIWIFAGDEATDYNRYTKRGLLSGVLVSTTLAWLNDEGDNLEAVSKFVDRRIENVMQLGRIIGSVKSRGFKKAS